MQRPLGIDERGREVLTFIDGIVPVPPFPKWSMSNAALESRKGTETPIRLMTCIFRVTCDVTPCRVASAGDPCPRGRWECTAWPRALPHKRGHYPINEVRVVRPVPAAPMGPPVFLNAAFAV